jgi:hypothetical protein
MKTKADLVVSVLQGLRIIAAAENPSAEDSALVQAAYDSKLAEWRRRGLVWWTNTDATTQEIPSEVFATLSDLMESECAGSFGVGQDMSRADKRAEENELLRGLRMMNAKPPSGEVTPFSSF